MYGIPQYLVIKLEYFESFKMIPLSNFLHSRSLSSEYNKKGVIRVFFYNSHRVKSPLLSLELSFRSLSRARQTSN